jgi:hypothetical protein
LCGNDFYFPDLQETWGPLSVYRNFFLFRIVINLPTLDSVVISSSVRNNCIFNGTNATLSQRVNMARYVQLSIRYRVIAILLAQGGEEGTSLRRFGQCHSPFRVTYE